MGDIVLLGAVVLCALIIIVINSLERCSFSDSSMSQTIDTDSIVEVVDSVHVDYIEKYDFLQTSL